MDVFLSMSSFPIIVRSLIRFRLAVAAEVPIVLVIAGEEGGLMWKLLGLGCRFYVGVYVQGLKSVVFA